MARQDSDNTTHFGYQTVATEEKADLVRGVFDSVASRYDIMNDLMSGGLHRLWKRYTIDQAAVRPGDVILDLAGGTGDLASRLSRMVGPEGEVVIADINGDGTLEVINSTTEEVMGRIPEGTPADVDRAVALTREGGGRAVAGPLDLGDVGRAAAVEDPQGAVVGLLRSRYGDPLDTVERGHGAIVWNELLAADAAQAAAWSAALAAVGLDCGSNDSGGADRLLSVIRRHHAAAQRAGIQYPEVEIREV